MTGTVPVPPIPAHQLLVLLIDLAVLLGAAVLVGRLARRCGMSPIVGELSVGVLLGPSVFGRAAPGVSAVLFPHDAAQSHLLDAVGVIGMLLLVGFAGTQVSLDVVRRRRIPIVSVGAGALMIPLACGLALGFLLPANLAGDGTRRTVFAGFLAVALAVSAIPVIAKTLMDLDLMTHEVGQLIIGAAAIDDTVGWVLLSAVAAAAAGAHGAGGVVTVVAGIVGVGVLCLLGRPLVRAVLRRQARSEPGVAAATVVVLILLGGAGTQALGLEAVLGAFAAGILAGSSGELTARQLTPLRTCTTTVLAPIFFATAGLRVDLTVLARPALDAIAALVIAVAIVSKMIGAYVGGRAAGLGHWPALALGGGLNARGMVEIVVAQIALSLGVLDGRMYTVIVLMTMVTSVLAAPLLRYAMRHVSTPAAATVPQLPVSIVADVSNG